MNNERTLGERFSAVSFDTIFGLPYKKVRPVRLGYHGVAVPNLSGVSCCAPNNGGVYV